jgi:hypothetical protein
MPLPKGKHEKIVAFLVMILMSAIAISRRLGGT